MHTKRFQQRTASGAPKVRLGLLEARVQRELRHTQQLAADAGDVQVPRALAFGGGERAAAQQLAREPLGVAGVVVARDADEAQQPRADAADGLAGDLDRRAEDALLFAVVGRLGE